MFKEIKTLAQYIDLFPFAVFVVVDELQMKASISVHSNLMAPRKSAVVTIQENRQKAAKMLIAVVIIFTICYIPVHAFNLFR